MDAANCPFEVCEIDNQLLLVLKPLLNDSTVWSAAQCKSFISETCLFLPKDEVYLSLQLSQKDLAENFAHCWEKGDALPVIRITQVPSPGHSDNNIPCAIN